MPITATWHVSIRSEHQMQEYGSGTAQFVIRSSFDEWSINRCARGCKRGGSESMCACVEVHLDEGKRGGITNDILVDLWCQMPACRAGQVVPGYNCVPVARHGFEWLRAPTGIRCSSVVASPLYRHTQTPFFSLHPSCTLKLCQHLSI